MYNAVIKTYRIPRIACDTAIWSAKRLVSFSHPDSTGRWRRTFKYRNDTEVVGARVWREVVAKEPHIGDDN